MPAKEEITIGVVKFESDAVVPTKKHDEDAGWDLFVRESEQKEAFVINPHKTVVFDLAIGLEIPKRHYGKLEARSSHAKHPSKSILGGVVDNPYRGSVRVQFHNNSRKPVTIDTRNAVAQIIIMKLPRTKMVLIEKFTTATERGKAGWGSTDKFGNNSRPATTESMLSIEHLTSDRKVEEEEEENESQRTPNLDNTDTNNLRGNCFVVTKSSDSIEGEKEPRKRGLKDKAEEDVAHVIKKVKKTVPPKVEIE